MNIPTNLKIVPLDEIPKGQECPVDNIAQLFKLALAMQMICEQEKGIGLSAVQVGIPLNFFVIDYSYFSTRSMYRYFINCEYKSLINDKEKSVEGCLSLRNPDGKLRYFEVKRFKHVSITGKELVVEPTLKLVDINLTPTDYYKIVFQHEIDHAHQVTIDQIGKELHLWKK